jgi:ABC transporter
VRAIEIRRLSKRYRDLTALDEVSLTVEPGEIMGLVGPNGAGKSTLVECLVGLRRPDGGSVRVLGLDPIAHATEVKQAVGVQLQSGRLPDRQRVGEALTLFASFYPDPVPSGRNAVRNPAGCRSTSSSSTTTRSCGTGCVPCSAARPAWRWSARPPTGSTPSTARSSCSRTWTWGCPAATG